jgi:exonuclease SbcD
VTLTGGAPAIEQIALRRPVPFLRIPETGEIRLDELEDRLAALELPHDLPIEWRPFVQVRLARAGLKAGFRAEVDQIAERFPVRIVEARPGDAGKAELEAMRAPATVRLGEIDPEELFRQAFMRTHHGAEPAPAHLDAFHQAAAAAAAEA